VFRDLAGSPNVVARYARCKLFEAWEERKPRRWRALNEAVSKRDGSYLDNVNNIFNITRYGW